jgi:hydroxysqualene synthase
MNASVLETPSGKTAADENFPVGSWLIRPDLRRHVHVFYRFARAADDIADNPALGDGDKVERLAHMASIIRGETGAIEAAAQSETAWRMRQSLIETGVTAQHCLDLLQAFTQDARKTRYRNWDELVGYCLLSAAPVGRQLLDLHGEDARPRAASDALCNALQVVNHLQDCGEDYRNLDRVYLPLDDLGRTGAKLEDLGALAMTPALRQAVDRVIAPLEALLADCADLVLLVEDPRIALECAIIRALCVRLTARLKREDPLATRVAYGKPAMARLALTALLSGTWRRWTRRSGKPKAAMA